MTELVNLAVALDERYDERARAQAIARVEAAGCAVNECDGAEDRVLSWIDLVFGGAWSGEAFVGTNVVATRGGAPVAFATYAPRTLRYRWLRAMAVRPGVGVFGPFGVAPEERRSVLGPSVLTLALCGLRRHGYATALIGGVGDERLIAYYARHSGARVVERYDRLRWSAHRYRTVVMATGEGSTFQSLAAAAANGTIPLDVAAVVCNVAGAGVLERARASNVPAVVLPWERGRESRASYDARLCDAVAELEPDLVLLLGWMHLLDTRFIRTFRELLNLHPAFLPLDPERDDVGMPDGSTIPAFRGPRAVKDAFQAKSAWIGSTVHRVSASADRGPVVIRVPLKVSANEDEADAYGRLRPIERAMVPRAVMLWVYER
ncbi:MAG: formyltransferase family protein [Candidatus Tyrphobacter sp.]